MGEMHFFSEEIDFSLTNPMNIEKWVSEIVSNENKTFQDLNFIFCSDQYLYRLNTAYLNHQTYTDILTFDHSEQQEVISGDIFVSIDRVTENAQAHHSSFDQELYRVMVHGVLHLLGYDDQNEVDKQQMRKKEEACLSLLSF